MMTKYKNIIKYELSNIEISKGLNIVLKIGRIFKNVWYRGYRINKNKTSKNAKTFEGYSNEMMISKTITKKTRINKPML